MKKILPYLLLILIIISTETSYAKQTQIDSLFTGLEDKPGFAVAVYKDGNYVLQKTKGLSNLDHNVKITEETVFDIGSLAMHITASCILKLEDQGKLLLSDNVDKYLSDLPSYKEGKITIRHLLNHTSGLMDYQVALSMSGKSTDRAFDLDDSYKLLLKQDHLGFTPGLQYEYSNSNYMLLSKLIKKVSGQSVNEFATESLFKPMNMSNTHYYENSQAVIKNKAMAYSETEKGFQINQNYNFTSTGDGRLYTCLKDLKIWVGAIDKNTTPVKNLELRLNERGVLNDRTTIGYSLGLALWNEKGYQAFGHNGYWGGYSAMFIKVKDLDFWVIAISNNENSTAPNLAYQILDYYLEDKAKEQPIIKPYKISSKKLEKYEGDYITFRNGYQRKIVVIDDTLNYQIPGGGSYKLMSIAKDQFKILGSSTDFKLKFVTLENGKTQMQFLQNGVIDYQYRKYQLIKKESVNIKMFTGNFNNKALGITYQLKEGEKNTIEVYVNSEKLMSYLPAMDGVFVSESTHHGYLKFNESRNEFTLNDYSFRPVKFNRINDES